MKNKNRKKELRTPLFENKGPMKEKKRRKIKPKYKHKNHWLMEDDAYYESPKYKDEEE